MKKKINDWHKVDLSKIKRNGWETGDYYRFLDIRPQDDIREHLLGDECWCKPRLAPVYGFPPLIIIHNAADGRG